MVTFRGLLEPSAGNFEFLSLGRREQIRDLRKLHPHIDRENLGPDGTWALGHDGRSGDWKKVLDAVRGRSASLFGQALIEACHSRLPLR